MIISFDIGCEPSPSVPAETLLQDGWKTYLLFFAVSKNFDKSESRNDYGVAVLDCQGCVSAKFGYPNDEGVVEHPLYTSGMGDIESSVMEVLDSPWVREVSEQRLASTRRIWGGRGIDWERFRKPDLRHFVILLKEKTFECLATSLVVERFCDTFDEAWSLVRDEFFRH